MKKTVISLFLICIILMLSGCYLDVEYEFWHDVSEITSIKIVEVLDFNYEKLYNEENVLVTIENTDVFLQEFSEIHCREIFNDPETVNPNTIVIKVEYSNGDYEYIDYIAQCKCYKDSAMSHNGYFILDKEQFEAFIGKYYTHELPSDASASIDETSNP
ncbi:MAG: hypothetical protein E7674_08775 [Ruminococcaceae bacterium]|nr:hypothetical protein [Oscillospiraceae bacterium]